MKIWHNKWVRWVWYNLTGLFCAMYLFHITLPGFAGWWVTATTAFMVVVGAFMFISALIRRQTDDFHEMTENSS